MPTIDENLSSNLITKQYLFLLDICSPSGQSICKNGGTCVVYDEYALECKCPKEFYGPVCAKGKTEF